MTSFNKKTAKFLMPADFLQRKRKVDGENMKKYNKDDVNFVKLGNYVITLTSAVLRENN